MVFDHLGFNVSDFAATKRFLVAALTPLGLTITAEGEGWAMIGRKGEGQMWFGALGPANSALHVAFSAAGEEQVQQFHAAALAAGGQDNGAPGPRPQYGPNYYAAFVIGPDGHNIEAIYRSAA